MGRWNARVKGVRRDPAAVQAGGGALGRGCEGAANNGTNTNRTHSHAQKCDIMDNLGDGAGTLAF